MRTSVKEGLLQRQQRYLQLTTQWRIRVRHFPNTNYANLSQQQVEKTIDAQIKETEQLLKERIDDGKEDMLPSLIARERERLRKTYEAITQGHEYETLITIEGHRTFCVAYGALEAISGEEGIRGIGYKELFLPGSYILKSQHLFLPSLDYNTVYQQLSRVRIEKVMPEASSSLFEIFGSPLLGRILLLGETPFHWLPEDFVRIEQQNSLYLLRSRYWYYDKYQIREKWLTGYEKPDTEVQEQISQMDLSVQFLIDPQRNFSISRFEDVNGQQVIEVTQWREYNNVWIPSQILVKRFTYDVRGGQLVESGGIPTLLGAEVTKRQTAQVVIELISVSETHEKRKMEDFLHPDLNLKDYRLGITPEMRAVSYTFTGSLPNLSELERMYKEQQQQQPPSQAQPSYPLWAWVPPAILIALGIVWYIRGRRLKRG